MKCFLDMDGVIADFVGAACKLHNLANPYPQHNGIWDFVEAMNLHPKTFWGPMGREFWANIEPTVEKDMIISMLEHKFGAQNICLLTSPCATDGCIDGKMDWIRKHMPDYKRRVLFGAAKEFVAHHNAVLVDDAEHNVGPFNELGGKGILLARPWNKRHPLASQVLIQLEQDLREIKIT